MAKNGTSFKKGQGGRPKGVKNKFTSLKQSVLDAFQSMGGTEGLIEWANKSDRNRRDFFAWAFSMLPKDQVVKLEEQFPKTIVIRQPAKPNNEQ